MKRIKHALALLLAVMMMTIAGLSAVAAEPSLDERIESAIVYLGDNFAAEFDPATGYRSADMWSLLTALAADKADDPDYAFLIPEYTADDLAALTNVADYAKAVISLTLLGQDASDYLGVNLVDALIAADAASAQANDWQNAANVIPYTVFALELTETEYDRDAMLARLTALQKTDGGFSWDSAAGTGDVDTTAPAIAALTLLGDAESAEKAADFIQSTEDENGYFVTPGGTTWEGVFYPNVANANSQAMGLIALAMVDQAPTDAQLDALLALQTTDGGFAYDSYSEFPDYYSTHQAIIALKGVDLFAQEEADTSSTPDSSAEIERGEEASRTPTVTVPATGDYSKVPVFIAIGVVALAAIVLCAVLPALKKKKSGKDEEK